MFQRLLFAIVFSFSFSATAQISDRIDQCYDDNGSTREAAYCADQKIARIVKRLRRRIRDLENGGNNGGGNNDGRSTFFACSNDPDPILRRSFISNSGEVLRQDDLLTFTVGGDVEEKQACQNEILSRQGSLGEDMQTLCRCTNEPDPVLRLELVNDDFKTIRTVDINTFTIGGDDQEKQDCLNFINRLEVCTQF